MSCHDHVVFLSGTNDFVRVVRELMTRWIVFVDVKGEVMTERVPRGHGLLIDIS